MGCTESKVDPKAFLVAQEPDSESLVPGIHASGDLGFTAVTFPAYRGKTVEGFISNKPVVPVVMTASEERSGRTLLELTARRSVWQADPRRDRQGKHVEDAMARDATSVMLQASPIHDAQGAVVGALCTEAKKLLTRYEMTQPGNGPTKEWAYTIFSVKPRIESQAGTPVKLDDGTVTMYAWGRATGQLGSELGGPMGQKESRLEKFQLFMANEAGFDLQPTYVLHPGKDPYYDAAFKGKPSAFKITGPAGGVAIGKVRTHEAKKKCWIELMVASGTDVALLVSFYLACMLMKDENLYRYGVDDGSGLKL